MPNYNFPNGKTGKLILNQYHVGSFTQVYTENLNLAQHFPITLGEIILTSHQQYEQLKMMDN